MSCGIKIQFSSLSFLKIESHNTIHNAHTHTLAAQCTAVKFIFSIWFPSDDKQVNGSSSSSSSRWRRTNANFHWLNAFARKQLNASVIRIAHRPSQNVSEREREVLRRKGCSILISELKRLEIRIANEQTKKEKYYEISFPPDSVLQCPAMMKMKMPGAVTFSFGMGARWYAYLISVR